MPSKRSIQAQKQKRQRSKIILFLVEGKSEICALEVGLASTCVAIDPTIVCYFLLMQDPNRSLASTPGGDITSKSGVNVSNIERLIDRLFFEPFFCANPTCFPRDVARIVHIVDTDGAFVDDSHIEESDDERDRIVYFEDRIVTHCPDNIVERNPNKSANLLHLAGLSKIKVQGKARPYSIYFFSSNLDHFLHGEANLKKQVKTAYADDFSLKCDLKPSLFYDTLQADTAYAQTTYTESWNKIREGTESLCRHTNLNILLRQLEEEYLRR